MTAASDTAGWRHSSCSTSAGETFEATDDEHVAEPSGDLQELAKLG
jgi:hypothetical protein